MPPRLRRSRPPLTRFAVAWFPRFEGHERIEGFRARHDPAASLIPAHLSLVFPFGTSHTRLQVETHVHRVISRWPPIPVAFRGVHIHANEFLFLVTARGAPSITALHDKLYSRTLLPHLRRDLPYEPHITVARHPDLARLERARDEAQDELRGEFEGVIREVALLVVRQDGRIDTLARIPLHSA